MSRPLSTTALQSIARRETDEVWLMLVKIDEETLPSPYYFVNNTEQITSNGQVYLPFPFTMDMPEDTSDRMPEVTLTIDAVDQQIVDTIRRAVGIPTVEMSVIIASEPDTVIVGPMSFSLTNATYDENHISGTLAYENYLNEPWPSGIMSPNGFAGLF